tara:strand:- start:653 stop:913 length:261 start_codon:yes stop_codon:yes gene_type:complete
MIYDTIVTLNENVSDDAPLNERYTFTKVKITPNSLAKKIVEDTMEHAGYWEETGTWNHEEMTENEKEQVRLMIETQVNRVIRFLNK